MRGSNRFPALSATRRLASSRRALAAVTGKRVTPVREDSAALTPQHWRLRPGVYGARWADEAILLDVNADACFGLDARVTAVLDRLLSAEESSADGDTALEAAFLVADDVGARGSCSLVPVPGGGLDACEWRPDLSAFRRPSLRIPARISGEVARAVRTSRTVLARHGLAGLLEQVRLAARQRARHSRGDVAEIAEAVVRTRRWYPMRIECLIGSAALALVCLQHGHEVSMVLGAQKFPLYMHAWIEVQGVVLNDVSEVNTRLAVLTRIPA